MNFETANHVFLLSHAKNVISNMYVYELYSSIICLLLKQHLFEFAVFQTLC